MKNAARKIEVNAKVASDEKLKKINVGGIEHLVPADQASIEKLILEGCQLTRRLEEIQDKLKNTKGLVLTYAQEEDIFGGKKSAKIVGLAGVCEITLKQDIKIADPVALKTVFGEKYELYVTEETVFKPQKKLRDALVDGDHPQSEVIREAVEIKPGEYIRFIPRD